MKVGIITFHRARNYGAVLQAYALMRFISENFEEVNAELIDYRSEYIEEFYRADNHGSDFLAAIQGKFLQKILLNRNKVFQKFVDKNLVLSDSCNAESIYNLNEYDKYIAGSDMLWHWHTTEEGEFFDDNYFLSFVKDKSKKNSYAASFGTDYIPEKYIDYYRRHLGDYNNISVREESGIDIIKNLVGKQAKCNIDPTLLFTMDNWKKIENRPQMSGYVLLYQVGGISNKLWKCARNIAKRKKTKLIVLYSEYYPLSKYTPKRGIFGYSPEEFLGWFDNADCVITNSFHGTAFSIIYHKKMLVDINSWTKNNRAYELMIKLGLELRTIDSQCDIEQPIDWSRVEEKLDWLRKDAKQYLDKILKS